MVDKTDVIREVLNDIKDPTTPLTTAQVAGALNLTRAAICNAVKEERLTATRVGDGRGFYLFDTAEVLKAIRKGSINPKVKGANGNKE